MIWVVHSNPNPITVAGNENSIIFLFSLQLATEQGVTDQGNAAVLCELKGHSDGILALAFNAQGTRLASGGKDGIVKVWAMGSYDTVHTLNHAKEALSVLLWREDMLYTGSERGMLRVWSCPHTQDEGEAECRVATQAHAHSLSTVALNSDGDTMLSGSLHEPAVKFWDVEGSGALKNTMRGYECGVTTLATGAGDQLLAAGPNPKPNPNPNPNPRHGCRRSVPRCGLLREGAVIPLDPTPTVTLIMISHH